MNHSFISSISGSTLHLFTADKKLPAHQINRFYSIIWNRGNNAAFKIDGIPFILKPNHIVTLTPSQRTEIEQAGEEVFILQFNDSFYCVEKHDREISCIGFIFYGASNIITIALPQEEQNRLHLLWEMFIEEFQNRDNIQGEMLTALLKRLIITCTRLAKEQHLGKEIDDVKYNLIRQFNILVEVHFREFHSVSFYAEKLHHSPKTVANIFALAHQPTPVTIIHNRIVTEAKRQLSGSEKSVKEIAYELGFADIQSFSRFFKKKTGIAPSAFTTK